MGLLSPLPLDEAREVAALLGVEVAEVEPLAAGSVNSNFRLRSTDGRRWFGRIYEEQAAAGARAERRLLEELRHSGVPVVPPLATASGDPAVTRAGRPFALYPWTDGHSLCQARVTVAHLAALGAALGRIHAATPRLTPLGEGRFRVADLHARLDRILATAPAHAAAARRIRADLERYEPLRARDLPSGVIHGDLFRDNVLWAPGEGAPRIAALLDFESASQGAFAYDVMVTLFAWCQGDALDPGLARAFLGGYVSERRFEPVERRALEVEGAIACLRFATTRITDFSMRAPPGEPPARDYRRFLARLDALEAGALHAELDRAFQGA
ncbi:MAG: phosphotransferase [Deltaproteobacteria bacterium]|nr:phosphotransferase [Deltaproteobacteria bacterium]